MIIRFVDTDGDRDLSVFHYIYGDKDAYNLHGSKEASMERMGRWFIQNIHPYLTPGKHHMETIRDERVYVWKQLLRHLKKEGLDFKKALYSLDMI